MSWLNRFEKKAWSLLIIFFDKTTVSENRSEMVGENGVTKRNKILLLHRFTCCKKIKKPVRKKMYPVSMISLNLTRRKSKVSLKSCVDLHREGHDKIEPHLMDKEREEEFLFEIPVTGDGDERRWLDGERRIRIPGDCIRPRACMVTRMETFRLVLPESFDSVVVEREDLGETFVFSKSTILNSIPDFLILSFGLINDFDQHCIFSKIECFDIFFIKSKKSKY